MFFFLKFYLVIRFFNVFLQVLSIRTKLSHNAAASHHRQHVEASLTQQVAQVADGRVGGDVGGEPPLPLCLGELEGAAQLVQGVPAHYGPDEHAIRFKDLLDLKSGGQRFIIHNSPKANSVLNSFSVIKGGQMFHLNLQV